MDSSYNLLHITEATVQMLKIDIYVDKGKYIFKAYDFSKSSCMYCISPFVKLWKTQI